MIAKITSPIPGPSSHTHRLRRRTLRVVVRGVVFIQRLKYVSLFLISYNLLIADGKGGQANFGGPNVGRNLPSELRSKMCVVDVEGSNRQDRYSRLLVRSMISYHYFSWLKHSCIIAHGSTAPYVTYV